MKSKPTTILGQPSYSVSSDRVTAWVTKKGGHLAPATFALGRRTFEPLAVAPWAEEAPDPAMPHLINGLRGDFFCLPFGGNGTPYRGERHPPHGETANHAWRFHRVSRDANVSELHMSMATRTRKGRVDKHIRLVDGHTAIYQRHVVSGMSGPMTPGHHALVKFPEAPGSGIVSSSAFRRAEVCPGLFEDPAVGGYQALKPGASFTSLKKAPLATGGRTDISAYPARRGFDDLVMLVHKPAPFAWTAVTFPGDRAVFFTLKDPEVLGNTILWMSNAGRHYTPWNGRHANVMGIEDITGYFHIGLNESAKKNPLSERGIKTCVKLSARKPFAVNYILGMAAVPAGFDEVKRIEAGDGAEIVLTAVSGKQARAKVDVSFLKRAE